MNSWRGKYVTDALRYIQRPGTDLSHVKMEKTPRTCPCGCKRTFTVAEGSMQRYASTLCKTKHEEETKSSRKLTSKEKMTAVWNDLNRASYAAQMSKKESA